MKYGILLSLCLFHSAICIDDEYTPFIPQRYSLELKAKQKRLLVACIIIAYGISGTAIGASFIHDFSPMTRLFFLGTGGFCAALTAIGNCICIKEQCR